MERINLQERAAEFLKKYRYVLLVLGVGILLMLLPGGNDTEEPAVEEPAAVQETLSLQQELAQILSQIEGAGKVSVLLTVSQGEKTVYQTDEDRSGDSLRVETVVITGADKAQHGLVQQVESPVYLGAVIVCQGGGNNSVRLAIVEAVSSATGLGADRITVLKMK